jgi:CubicO group peptidase (beta-lactamase class C family)
MKNAKFDGYQQEFYGAMMHDSNSITFKAFNNPPSILLHINSPQWQQYGQLAAGAVATSESLARFYNLLISHQILNDKYLQIMTTNYSHHKDLTLLTNLHFGAGVILNNDNMNFGFKDAFGHAGAGGSLCFASPKNKFAFAFTTQSLGNDILIDKRLQTILETYEY